MGRGHIVVKYNHLAAIAAALPQEIGDGVDETANGINDALRGRLWKRTGVVVSTVQDRDPSRMHALISVGIHHGRGFYSRFNEWGTSKQAARPVVGPVAHEWEPRYYQVMIKHIKIACGRR